MYLTKDLETQGKLNTLLREIKTSGGGQILYSWVEILMKTSELYLQMPHQVQSSSPFGGGYEGRVEVYEKRLQKF